MKTKISLSIAAFTIGAAFAWLRHGDGLCRPEPEVAEQPSAPAVPFAERGRRPQKSQSQGHKAGGKSALESGPSQGLAESGQRRQKAWDRLLKASQVAGIAERERALREELAAAVRVAPHVAVRFMREHVASLPAASLEPVVSRWMEVSIEDAIEWIEAVPDEEKRNALMLQGIGRWGQARPDELEHWLLAQKPAAWRDEMIVRLFDSSVRRNFENRFHLAMSITSGDLQFTHAPGWFFLWWSADPAAAQAWLDSARLTRAPNDPVMLALQEAMASEPPQRPFYGVGDASVSLGGKRVTIHY